jgi:predicted ATP-grasp superfamily ATP-dependent carboligase
MRVLLFEYVTGGGFASEALPAPLAREGGLMLATLLHDFAELPDVALTVFRDVRLPRPAAAPPWTEWRTVGPGDTVFARFKEALRAADAVWPIAPETGGILEHLCARAEAAGCRLLTSPAVAVRLAASKQRTARRLAERHVPAVPTIPVAAGVKPPWPAPWVVKPDDGAGCEGARVLATDQEWRVWRRSAPSGSVVQPFRTGDSLSLSALFHRGEAQLLAWNRQRVRRTGDGFLLAGCEVNALPDVDGVAAALASAVGAALPELWGYAGIDLIRSDTGLEVLEVNPRLTTSAAGLGPALGLNLARAVLDLAGFGRLPQPLSAVSGRPCTLDLEEGHAH